MMAFNIPCSLVRTDIFYKVQASLAALAALAVLQEQQEQNILDHDSLFVSQTLLWSHALVRPQTVPNVCSFSDRSDADEAASGVTNRERKNPNAPLNNKLAVSVLDACSEPHDTIRDAGDELQHSIKGQQPIKKQPIRQSGTGKKVIWKVVDEIGDGGGDGDGDDGDDDDLDDQILLAEMRLAILRQRKKRKLFKH
ncbi:hypothetical protein LX36DRAFT_656180 [Colletotrichum falcatum]|nr:hypothetical protein LX36DRAFT_656180 [Colletotrichum falcatum]